MDAFKKARQKMFKKMKPGFLKCKILRAEPVNSITGEVVVEQSDFTIDGRIPIEWGRTYGSSSEYRGACGNGWQTPADIRLEIDRDGQVLFYDGGPGATVFPEIPEDPHPQADTRRIRPPSRTTSLSSKTGPNSIWTTACSKCAPRRTASIASRPLAESSGPTVGRPSPCASRR